MLVFMRYCYDYPRPAVTVDAAVLVKKEGAFSILLIERKHDPFKGCYALPGGFVDEGETLEEAIVRELKEETNLSLNNLQQFRAYSRPDRDPRGRTISVIFTSILDAFPAAVAGDDAAAVKWFPLDQLPELAFDHGEIVADIKKILSIE
ncbi:Bifunctional NMN adenylyltransferase/Nudix hydrolase [bioreactor metagenome]|uniref:Bifunctional NMN adenylyltransferase/Nudix hydrolase n=1 Tax=bioreactor metagenome TaxID=1076179 RepID=A0A644Y6U1_9ZZZZ